MIKKKSTSIKDNFIKMIDQDKIIRKVKQIKKNIIKVDFQYININDFMKILPHH